MAKKSLPKSVEDLKGAEADFFATIQKESDRGYVLVAAAFLEEALELRLRRFMEPLGMHTKEVIEQLFKGALRSFSTKTNLAFALGLIPDYAHHDLERIRELRNHFAHSYVDATFTTAFAVETVAKLKQFGTVRFPPSAEEKKRIDYVRTRFGLAASWMAGAIHKDAGMRQFVEG